MDFEPIQQAIRPRAGAAPASSPRLVYVAGANRSGSTLLEVLLSLHPDTVSAGELFNAARMLRDPSLPCTCGKTLGECSLWGGVAAELVALGRARGMAVRDLAKAIRRVEDHDALDGYLHGRSPDPDAVTLYTSVQRLVIDSVARTRPGARWLVDPSKSQPGAAARPLALQRHLGLDLRILHLVRDPRGVVASVRRGTNKALERGEERTDHAGGARALWSWLRVNRDADRVIACLGEERALRVRFEDLLTRTAEVVTEICAFLALEPAPILAALEQGALPPPEHMIAGNRLRFAPIRLEARHARAELPWYYGPLCAMAARLAGRGPRRVGQGSRIDP